MSVSRYAAIEVAAQEIQLKIYEISAKTGIRNIDVMRRSVPVGKDTYSSGKISADVLERICDVLNSMKETLKAYHIDCVRAAATSAVREAKNCAMVLDQIRVRTGFDVSVLSNSEQRFIRLKGASAQKSGYSMMEKGTMFVDIGSGSLQVSIFDKMTLVTTQNILLGTAKIDELFYDPEQNINTTEGMIKELIDNDIQTFEKMFLKDHEIKNVIFVGDSLVSYIRRALEKESQGIPTVEDFARLYQNVMGKTPTRISREMGIPAEYASMVMSTVMVFKSLLDASGAVTMSMPKADLCDGLVLEAAESNKLLRSQHDFNEDILASSRTICKRYMGNKKHAGMVEETVCQIFDVIRKYHGLGQRERLLLQIAAILHDCGKFISMSAPGDSSYHIIMSTEILGLSHAEREIVANIARYNTLEFPSYDEFEGKLSLEQYLVVMKLAAIMRVGNALDRSHKQKFSGMKLALKDSMLTITTNCASDITLEKSILNSRTRFFEEVYGIRIQVKVKK